MAVTTNQTAFVYWSLATQRADGCVLAHVAPGTFTLTFPTGRGSAYKNAKLTIAVGLATASYATFVWISETLLEVSVWDGVSSPPVKADPDELSIAVEVVPRVS